MHLAAGQNDTAPQGILASIPVRQCVSVPIGANPDKVGPSGGFLTGREKSGLGLLDVQVSTEAVEVPGIQREECRAFRQARSHSVKVVMHPPAAHPQ